MKIKKSLLVLLIIMLIIAVSGCSAKSGSEVVATVNGESITRQQLDEMFRDMKSYFEQTQGIVIDDKTDEKTVREMEAQILEQLIDQAVLLQEAKKIGVAINDSEIKKEIKSYKESITEEQFKKVLASNGWSETKFFEMVKKSMIIEALDKKVLDDLKPLTEGEVKDYFDKNPAEFTSPLQYEVRHILFLGSQDDAKKDLEARTRSLAALEQLKKGNDFAELAKEKSEDPGSAPEGGLFTFGIGDVVPEFEKAVLSLKPGETTNEPVKTMYGYHLIRLEKIIPEEAKSFADVKDELAARLNDKAGRDFIAKFLDDAKKRSEINNNLTSAKTGDSGETGSQDVK